MGTAKRGNLNKWAAYSQDIGRIIERHLKCSNGSSLWPYLGALLFTVSSNSRFAMSMTSIKRRGIRRNLGSLKTNERTGIRDSVGIRDRERMPENDGRNFVYSCFGNNEWKSS